MDNLQKDGENAQETIEPAIPLEIGVSPVDAAKIEKNNPWYTIGVDIPLQADQEILEAHAIRLKKIENLDQCPKLKTLKFVATMIETLECLENVPELEYLEVYQNCVKKIKNLDTLTKLRILNLSYNKIKTIENLDNLTSLTKLYLSSNKIESMTGVRNLVNLQVLELGSNKIRTMTNEIENMADLEELWLGRNKIAEINFYRSYLHLNVVDLQNNRLQSWSGSFKQESQMPESEAEVLDNLGPSGAFSIFDQENVEVLMLSHNRLPNPPPELTRLRNLTTLDLSNNEIIDSLEVVGQCTSLKELWMSSNNISNPDEIRKLAPLKNLQTLYLEHNPIQHQLGPGYRTLILSVLPHIKQIDAVSLEAPKITVVRDPKVQGILQHNKSSAAASVV